MMHAVDVLLTWPVGVALLVTANIVAIIAFGTALAQARRIAADAEQERNAACEALREYKVQQAVDRATRMTREALVD